MTKPRVVECFSSYCPSSPDGMLSVIAESETPDSRANPSTYERRSLTFTNSD